MSEQQSGEGRWRVVHRVTYDGWNVVVADGLHIGPFERDKAQRIVEDHNAELETLRRERADLERQLAEARAEFAILQEAFQASQSE